MLQLVLRDFKNSFAPMDANFRKFLEIYFSNLDHHDPLDAVLAETSAHQERAHDLLFSRDLSLWRTSLAVELIPRSSEPSLSRYFAAIHDPPTTPGTTQGVQGFTRAVP